MEIEELRKNLNESIKESIKDFETAIKLDPKYFMAYNNLAEVYDNLGKHKKAKEILAKKPKEI